MYFYISLALILGFSSQCLSASTGYTVDLSAAGICSRHDVDQYNTYYPGDCSKYIKCDHGKPIVEKCGWLHRFDEKTNECKFNWFFNFGVDCSAANQPVVTPPTPTESLSLTVMNSVQEATYQCKNNTNYSSYFQGNCRYYWKCANGKATKGDCGWWYKYNENTNECKFDFFGVGINCSKANQPIPTPTPTPTGGTAKPTGPTTSPPNGSSTKKGAANDIKINIFLLVTALLGLLMTRQ